ncbi:uncharacterized protein LOC21389299 isoform X1 [Morus notabilis]|uniref:uncharacterized protein LOC21389299 isoform X1 n=1 Tax=Morus notabilis TaxID=981085 RepID=UPI000CED5ADE|nr:uncharacterized protein LOC21389299 isoform X1 [Morus notabilis]
MFDWVMRMSLHTLYNPSSLLGLVTKDGTNFRSRRRRTNYQYVTPRVSSVLVQTDENGNSPENNKVFSSSGMAQTQRQRCQASSNHFLGQPNSIGIIGGISAFSTLIFLEKLVWWGSKCGVCPPFVVCSDSALHMKLSSFHSLKNQISEIQSGFGPVVEILRSKRVFLEQSGASCIVMPCHVSYVWHSEISEGCSLPFLHVGECVAKELSEANFKPLEVGSNVRIGVLATNAALVAGIFQDKLQNQGGENFSCILVLNAQFRNFIDVQGFEVVLPDKRTMEHVVIPSAEALKRGDVKGARNLLKIAVQILLMRGVNTVIIASHEMQGLLPYDDPLLQKCTDPMDALARSTIKWAKSMENMVFKRSK